MTPQEALRNIMTAVTGDAPLNSGIYLGSYRQHATLQESIEVLNKLVQEDEIRNNTKATDT